MTASPRAPQERFVRILRLSCFGLCLILFTASATTDLALPGPPPDECVHATLTLDLMRPPYPYGQYTLQLGQQPFPFGVDPHTGALKAYLLWPFFAMFGPSVELMRLFSVGIGLSALLFFYLFARRAFGPAPALCAAFLLCLDSSFIFYSKLDAGPIVEQLLWMMVGLWGFVKWKNSCKSFYLVLGLASAVLGIYSHIAFIWVATSFSMAALLFYRDTFRDLFKRPVRIWTVGAAFLFFSIFLYWLIGEKRLLVQTHPGLWGAWSMFERVSIWGGIFVDVLLGDIVPVIPSSLERTVRPLTDIFISVSLFFLVLRYHKQPRAVRCLMVSAVLMFLQILWTPGSYAIYPHRMMYFYVVLLLLSGVAVVESFRLLRDFAKERLWGTIGTAVIFLALLSVWGQVAWQQEIHQQIRRHAGKDVWSDAIYCLADLVQRGEWDRVICLDEGFRRPLFVLTQGKVPLIDAFVNTHVTSSEETQRLLFETTRSATPRTLFLVRPVRLWKVGVGLKGFLAGLERINQKPSLVFSFHDREGDPVFFAYTIQND